MKKVLFAVAVVCALAVTSCGSFKSTTYTAHPVDIPTVVASENLADLEVGARTTYRYTTSKADRAGGIDNCKKAAIAAFLKNNGNADVIVAPEFVIDADVNYVEVTGRPGKYKNFRSAH